MEILDTASSPENEVSFSDDEIAIVKKAMHTKLFRRTTESYEVRLPKFQLMITELSEIFGIPEVKVVGLVEREPGFGRYNVESNTIETEKFLSLVTVLSAFAVAITHHKPELRMDIMAAMFGQPQAGKLKPLAFALSAYKQAAPRMFDDAKNRGRLRGTTMPYTDDGRLPANNPLNGGDAPPPATTGEESAPEGGTIDLPAPPQPPAPGQPRRIQPPSRPSNQQRPDLDPEIRDEMGG